MKPTLPTLGIGAVLVVAVGLLAVTLYDKYLAILLWPGFLIIDYVFSQLGFEGIAFASFGWIFWPSLALNAALHGLLYLPLSRAVAGKWKPRSASPNV